MTAKPIPTRLPRRSAAPEAPKALSPEARKLWRRVVRAFDLPAVYARGRLHPGKLAAYLAALEAGPDFGVVCHPSGHARRYRPQGSGLRLPALTPPHPALSEET